MRAGSAVAAHLYLNLLREIFWFLFQAPRLDGRALLYLWHEGGRGKAGREVGDRQGQAPGAGAGKPHAQSCGQRLS
jgi:hypothetical protein